MNKFKQVISICLLTVPLLLATEAFADRPIEDMTDEFDLIVIDYPHVGEVAAKGLLAQLDTPSYKKQLEKLRESFIKK